MDNNIQLPNIQDDSSVEENLKQRLNNAIKTSWLDYYQTINELPMGYEIAPCLKLLHIADELLNQRQDFSESSVIERYLVGGVKDNQVENIYPFETQLLGDMQGFASFKKLIKKDPEGLDKLLKIIPSNGPIDGWHYMQFVDGFKQLFSDNDCKQAYVFPLTRLMSMKRPDQFVALNQASATLFCQALSISPLKNQDFQRYWDDIILPIQQSFWYKTDQPMDASQLAIYRARFALLERIICTPIEIAEVIITKVSSATLSSADAEPAFSTDAMTPAGVNNIATEAPPVPIRRKVSQPTKMTIAKRKSAKVNKNAATKLMSRYYFANKEKFGSIDMSVYREHIIDKLLAGESVEEAFSEILESVN